MNKIPMFKERKIELVLVIGDWSLFGFWCLEFGYFAIS
jgi:hypothetical protein